MLKAIDQSLFDVIFDLRYCSRNNILGSVFTKEHCYLHEEAAVKLEKASNLAKSLGYKLKIFDAYRPIAAQQKLWDKFQDERFVSNPETGSIPHCRGVAIDLTLANLDGSDVEMGTDFDDFTEKAFHGASDIDNIAKKNRCLLLGIMMTSGWDFYRNEWWHYQLFNPRDYDIISDYPKD